jgi:tRNA threonylcarbamoyl adenosine modification protein (Sua5/YciO/YrdC/YwlC family)
MTTKQKTVGIRVPDNNICRALVEELGNPIVTTSAILAEDGPPLLEIYELEEVIGNQVDTIINGGIVYPTPSTVVSLVNDVLLILRQGKGDTTHLL